LYDARFDSNANKPPAELQQFFPPLQSC